MTSEREKAVVDMGCCACIKVTDRESMGYAPEIQRLIDAWRKRREGMKHAD